MRASSGYVERNLPELEVNVHFFLTRGYTGGMDSLSARDKKNHGFTLLEMIISIAIIVLLSVQVLSFSGLKEGTSLTRAAQELGFAVRRAQSMALAVNALRIGGTVQIPPSVAIRLSSSAGSNKNYFFFSDLDRNGSYSANERIEPDLILPGSIFIQAITLSDGTPVSIAHIIFTTPEATMTLTNDRGNTVGMQINVVLQGTSGATRTNEIRTSGQVTITNP